MVLYNGVFAEGFRPEKVGFTENSPEYSTRNAEKDENKIVNGFVVDTIFGFEQDKFSSACRIEGFEYNGSCERAKKCSPKYFSGEVCGNFLKISAKLLTRK
jgi:hypothetical protein